MNPPNPPSPTARLLLDAAAIERALKRIAHEIIERNPDLSRLAIVGIPSRGVVVAQRLAGFLQQFGDASVETARSTISLLVAPLGPLLAGVLLSTVSARATVAVFAAVSLALAFWGTLSPSIRGAPSLADLEAV